LAKILKFDFWDMDQWIEHKLHKKVKDIFLEDGEPFFREQETQAIDWLIDKKKYVVSTGGGVWVEDKNRAKLLGMGWSVWLKVSASEALKRVGAHLEQRPLLASSPDPRASFEAILAKREPFYSLAHAQVETDGKSPREAAKEIHRLLLKANPFDLP